MRKLPVAERRVIEAQARALERVAGQLDKAIAAIGRAGGSIGAQETLREVMRSADIQADRLAVLLATEA